MIARAFTRAYLDGDEADFLIKVDGHGIVVGVAGEFRSFDLPVPVRIEGKRFDEDKASIRPFSVEAVLNTDEDAISL
jgi:hypothetical protein